MARRTMRNARVFGPDLRKRYLKRLETTFEFLTSAQARLTHADETPSDLEQIEREAHRLSGSGATYGYPKISWAAADLEQCIRHAPRVESVRSQLASLVSAVADALADKDSIERFEAVEPDGGAAGYRPLVLLAGEAEASLKGLRDVLRTFARVQCFGSGSAVIHAARSQRFDLILLDYAIRGATGQQILAALETHREEISAPVVWMTSRPEVSLDPYIAAGVQDLICRTLQRDTIVERLKLTLAQQKPVVLVADDDPLIRGVIRAKLRQRGAEVQVASSGEQALDLAHRFRPHAIILDRIMPGCDGLEVLATIRRNLVLSPTPILMLSARRTQSDVADGLGLGANEYICKPFLPEQVVERCLQLIQGASRDPSRGPARSGRARA